MKRRSFLQQSILVGTALSVSPNLLAAKGTKTRKLTILHTNDTHSNIDPFPATHAKYPGRGGVVARNRMIEQVRSEEEQVLLLDAGDIFQGTPYFNKYHGVLEMKLMSKMAYDAATMGNHDFDAGLDGFLRAQEEANFPFLCANYDFSDTVLAGKTQSRTTIQKGSVKVGIFGLGVELAGLVPDSKFGETRYLDPIETARVEVKALQDEGCDLIICLSHLGYDYEDPQTASDLKLARETSGIHLIIGGHTHTFLEKPTVVTNAEGQQTLVNQVGWAGVTLGRIDFHFDPKRRTDSEQILIIADNV